MLSSVRKIGFLILLILILPVVVFSVFEVGNLRQNEKVIWNIYNNQLDAILFSINQYSEEVISGFALKIENSTNDNKNKEGDILNILNELPSLQTLLQFDENLNFVQGYKTKDSAYIKKFRNILQSNDTVLQKLYTYMSGGYRKIEPLNIKGFDNQVIVFTTLLNNKYITNAIVLDPVEFISVVLDPKIQESVRGKFYISAYREGEKGFIYNSEKLHETRKIIQKKPFWLFPGYFMGIELIDATIADLAKVRMRKNMIVIGLMDLILLFSALIIYRNIKKQIELSQLKSDFVSNVSHEIRTPLALISMYIETLEMGRVKTNEKIKEYYSIILNETQRLSGMVNRILSFSQIESNKRKYSFHKTDLNEIVSNSINTFRFNLENKGFKLNSFLQKNLSIVNADKEAIAEAFVNLIDNAIKYSAEEKMIEVKTGSNGLYVYIEVKDNGIGISTKDQKYIFDKFYRVTEKNLANKVKGSGLGLAIVKHIMDAHKGKIEVESEPGNGSLFRLLFPVEN